MSASFESASGSSPRPQARFGRSSGVLLHPTSLPGGGFGDAALRFLDWLAEAGQQWWQVLPLGPPDAHRSPYSSASAFAASASMLADPRAAVSADEVEAFVGAHPYWIADWTTFAGRGAIGDQVRFEREWGAIRRHARERGIRVLGDLPFYVAPGGADAAGHPRLFQHDAVAGVPPDDWSASGQLWGNPLYDWRAMRDDGFRWWIERFRRTLELVDAIRIDHFRGFVAYWAVPRDQSDARHGRWHRGPAAALFDAVGNDIAPLPVVAENLGVITPAVERLRRELRMPGSVVMQFRFSDNLQNRPPDEIPEDAFVYTGTHDNNTTVGWWQELSDREQRRIDAEVAAHDLQEDEPNWKLIDLAFACDARVAIVPAQDVLGLDGRARMNYPGREAGNWRWQLRPGELSVDHAKRLRELTEATQRTAAAMTVER